MPVRDLYHVLTEGTRISFAGVRWAVLLRLPYPQLDQPHLSPGWHEHDRRPFLRLVQEQAEGQPQPRLALCEYGQIYWLKVSQNKRQE